MPVYVLGIFFLLKKGGRIMKKFEKSLGTTYKGKMTVADSLKAFFWTLFFPFIIISALYKYQ